MQLSTKTRYGLRAMVDLSIREGQGPILIDSIARRQEVSRKYLDAIFSRLREAGLVRSQRGAKGGVMLGRPSNSITVADVVEALDGPVDLVDCGHGHDDCARRSHCATQILWLDLSRIIVDHLAARTLDQLASHQRQLDEEKSLTYHI